MTRTAESLHSVEGFTILADDYEEMQVTAVKSGFAPQFRVDFPETNNPHDRRLPFWTLIWESLAYSEDITRAMGEFGAAQPNVSYNSQGQDLGDSLSTKQGINPQDFSFEYPVYVHAEAPNDSLTWLQAGGLFRPRDTFILETSAPVTEPWVLNILELTVPDHQVSNVIPHVAALQKVFEDVAYARPL